MDESLMESLSRSDERALEALMDRHWTPLLRWALTQVGREDDAKDVAQEVFIRVWERRRSWKPGGSVRSYLYRIARNLIVDRSRRHHVRERADPFVRRLRSPPHTPLEEAVHGELREAFELALSLLPSRRREAFTLVRYRGLSLKEAAEVMELAPQTVANHVYLALCDLEEALGPHCS